jgi:hypothetical protein
MLHLQRQPSPRHARAPRWCPGCLLTLAIGLACSTGCSKPAQGEREATASPASTGARPLGTPATTESADPSSRALKVAACIDKCTKRGEACTQQKTVDGGISSDDVRGCTQETQLCLKACYDE